MSVESKGICRYSLGIDKEEFCGYGKFEEKCLHVLGIDKTNMG